MNVETIYRIQKKVLRLDSEGVGRSNLSKSNADTKGLTENLAAGLDNPKSGRIDIHPAVIETAKAKYKADISDWTINKLNPAMINEDVIVLVLLTEIEKIPKYVFQQAFDVLLAPIQDPANDIENKLEHTANQISHINWLLDYVLIFQMDKLGTNRDVNGCVIPRNLIDFDPKYEDKYSLREQLFENLKSNDQDGPFSKPAWKKNFASMENESLSSCRGCATPRIPRLDDWGEESSLTRPTSFTRLGKNLSR